MARLFDELEHDAAGFQRVIRHLEAARQDAFVLLGALDEDDHRRLSVMGAIDALDDSLSDLRGDLWGIQQALEEREMA